MKRIALVVACIALLAASVHGQEVTVLALQKGKAPSPTAHKQTPALEVVGRVDAVTLANPGKGVRPEISVVDDAGMRYTLLVAPTTTIYGPDWKAISLEKLTRDQQVRIQYTKSKDGSFTALSIKPAAPSPPQP